MEDGRGFAVGLGLDMLGLDSTSRDVFAEDAVSVGIAGFLRYDVWRPGDSWALGLFASWSHHSEGAGAEPPGAAQVFQNVASGMSATPSDAPLASRGFTNTVLLGAELRHGLLPWLIPFVHAAGGVSFVAVDVTDPSDCAHYQALDIPGVELPSGADPVELCSAYRVRHRATSAPAAQASFGLTLRPAPNARASRVVASPIAVSIEAGYLYVGDASLAPDGIDDTDVAQQLDSLSPSSWIARASLHLWF